MQCNYCTNYKFVSQFNLAIPLYIFHNEILICNLNYFINRGINMVENIIINMAQISESKVIKTPEGHDDPPEKYFCSECGYINKCVHKKSTTTSGCFFCKCGRKSGPPFLACERCNFKIIGFELMKCKYCDVSVNFKMKYCSCCGQKSD